MPKVLLLHAHPAPHKSHANRLLLDAARRVEGVTVRQLYELYPDFLIDVPAEQQLLSEHDVVVFQHPFYWYSAPSLMKEWLDLVLQHGWAYGEGGTRASRGKPLLQAVTCGGSLEVYCSAGRHGHTVRDFLLPVRTNRAPLRHDVPRPIRRPRRRQPAIGRPDGPAHARFTQPC